MPRLRSAWSIVCAVALLAVLSGAAHAQNAIVLENQNAGTPQAVWDVSGAGDLSIQGFATDISVNVGETVRFKIKTDANPYHIDIYRLGYYQGNGARLVGTGVITASLPQVQPADLYDAVTGLTDCGNWGESAHWDVPSNAVSGIYIARLTRDDNDGASHIAFVVRDDASTSDLFFQTSDATWQAYNSYGGNNLYSGSTALPSGHASKVSYNRPFVTRGGPLEDWVFNAEYPMVRWLEKNGYDVTYTTDVDTDRRGNRILQHNVWMSVGHDEYWSAGARANVQAARDAGVHLAFFSGNEIYWKTRYEPSIDGTNTDYRTLVCYKEGSLGENVCGGKCDPLPNTWTGLWRDGCAFSPPDDGCRPENALSGQISWIGSTGAITVPDTYKNLRFWRNTSIATLGAGQSATLAPNSLGYEWDWQQFEASYPARRILLSTTNLSGQTHHLSLYRHDSGALVFGAGTVQWSWGLDSNHDRGNDPPNDDMKQATVNLFADMGAQPGSLEAGLVNASASADAVAPSSVIGFPLDGSSTPSGTAVNITGTASDAGGGLVAGVEVSVDGGTTWHAAVGTTAWSYAWTPVAQGAVTLRSRAFDDTGNLETASNAGNTIAVTVTAPAPPVCPCTAWDPGTIPGTPDANDVNAIEVGVRFRSDVDGVITGVRFYKASANTGIHIGKLYTNAGTPLATDAFTGETASGWQEVTFTSPVAVTQGTTYVASVWMPAGHYAFAGGFFTNGGVDRAPVHLLQNGIDGANGVYNYGSQGFPTATFNASNYWVDVVFDNDVGPDVTPPTITAISPGNGASGVLVGSTVTATFSEAMNAATIDGATFELRTAGNALVPASVAYSSANRRATLTPTSPLEYSSTYTARVLTGVQDDAGNALATALTWTFTTGAPPPPPPNEGPGGPILVISAAANPFSRYPVEILRNEGLNAFTAMDLSLVTPAILAAYDVVVLGECALSAADVTMLSDWTTAGGTLIAFRPSALLAPLLGLTPAGGTLSNAYLLVQTASGPGAGIVPQTMQFHGTADLYTLNGATAVATLYSTASTATANPAVTTRLVGSNGGRALAFAYDLARSVVYTRQGNPAWAGTKRDGQIEPIRSDDQFFGAAAGDPQPDWIDFTKIAIPQADEQQRLLANAILQGNLHRKPLPRFWYLPKGLKAAVVMTGDNHGDGGMQPRFDIYRAQSTPGCSVDDWECIRATGYLYVGSTFTPAQAAFYDNLGFEVAVHINTGCARATQAQYEGIVQSQSDAFAATYPGLPPLVTNRNHCIAWSDWSSVPEVEAAHGIRLDTNYYYWPPGWVQDRPGFFTGGGMPMRFAKVDGTLIDCYQAATEMPDESGETFPAFCDALLDRAQGPEGYYGVFTTNMHFDSSPHGGSDAVVASAQAHNVPVVSAKQMLTWIDGRNASSFGGLAWSGNQLSFSIAVGSGARNLRAMLPLFAAVGQLNTLTRDGNAVAFTTQTIKGIEYAFFPADAGNYAATYLVDETPPAISAVTATPHTDGTATIAWTTDETSDSQVDYGTAPGSLTSNAGSAALVTSHSVTLSGLVQATTYHFRVRSTDAASNMATEPVTSSDPLSFTMPSGPCAHDQTAADFAQGSTGAGTAVMQSGDGEVTLAPAVNEIFSGAGLPAGWDMATWTSGGSALVSGGLLTVSGADVHTTTTFGPVRSIEFVATFLADPYQNVGLAASSGFGATWVTFGTSGVGNAVYARASDGTDLLISSALLGAPHRYRIVENAPNYTFFVDGSQVATIAFTTGGLLLPIASDFNLNGLALTVDWLRLTPYAAAGSYTSRVFDSGGIATWGAATWVATVPGSTSLAMFQRQGATPIPDGSWSAFTSIGSSGTIVGGNSRYIQYRADLATTDGTLTPVLDDMQFACSTTPDGTAPVISSIVATPGSGGTTAGITWATDEGATSRVDYGTSPGALSLNSASPSFVTSHALSLSSLTPSTTYYYRVTSADASANSATAPESPAAPLSFTTESPAPSVCAVDQTAADFAGGTRSGTKITQAGDGEVALAPGLDVDFSGSALPAGWVAYDWPFDAPTGTATVAGGVVTIDGMRVNPDPSAVSPGASLEFVATFSGDANQHVGFGGGAQLPPNEVFDTTPWAIFSTAGGGSLKARTHNGGSADDFVIPGSWLGAAHRFRIDWGASVVTFSIDGTVVHTSALAVPGPMRPAASDLFAGGGGVIVDEMSMTPYAAAGTFESRVHDAGSSVAWASFSWSATTPPGTSLAMSVRTGDTSVPDGTWSAYATLAGSGSTVGTTARYLQYRAELATSDPALTPSLADVSVTCSACAGPAPGAIADAAVALLPTGGSGGRLPVRVTFTAPAEAASVEVYRAPFGGYPRYDDDGGTTPATPSYPPGPPWVLTAVTASGQSDSPATRDVWYYAVFSRNACGVVSAVSNVPAGIPNYALGDVSNGVTACSGDNLVGTLDLTLLGAHYGTVLTGSEAWTCLDVGPTLGGSIHGRPLTDAHLDFEDLIIFGLTYGSTGPAFTAPALIAAAQNALVVEAPASVRAGDTFDVVLRMQGAGDVQGLSAQLAWDASVAQPLQVAAGSLLELQRGVAYSSAPGRVDAVLLGAREQGITGEGALATFTFRARVGGDPGIRIGDVLARDAANRPIVFGGSPVPPAAAPSVTALERVAPNPFQGQATAYFSLAQEGVVDLSIYAVDGRRVRTLVHGSRPAGAYHMVWNGADESGAHVRPGQYYVQLQTSSGRFSRKLVYLR